MAKVASAPLAFPKPYERPGSCIRQFEMMNGIVLSPTVGHQKESHMPTSKTSTTKGKQGGSSAQHAEAGKQSHKNSVSKSGSGRSGSGRKGSGDSEA